MTLELRKYHLIKMITESKDEHLVEKLEILALKTVQSDLLTQMSQPLKNKLDLDELIKEQNYIHPTQEELEQIMKDADVTESLYELLEIENK